MADTILAIDDSTDCVISDSGNPKLLRSENGTSTEVEFAPAIKKANSRAASARRKLAAAIAAGASKSKKAKLKEKKTSAKKYATNLKKCQAGTLTQDDLASPSTGNGSNLRSEITMTALGSRNPAGVTCQLSTGTNPKLTAEYGSAEASSDQIIGLIGCRTNDGSAFDSSGLTSSIGYIQGFLFSSSTSQGITGFQQTDFPRSGSVFVQQLCGSATTCQGIETAHTKHKSGSAGDIRFELVLERIDKEVDFQGDFGGKGKSF